MATEINLQKPSKADFIKKKKKNLLLTIRPLTFSFSGKHGREEWHLWQNAVKMCVPQVQAGAALEEDSPWSAFLGVWRWVLPLSLLPLENFCFETGVSLNSELTDSTGLAGWWAPLGSGFPERGSQVHAIKPSFSWEFWELWTLVFMCVWQEPPWPSHLSALSKCLNCILLCSKQTLLVFFPFALEQLLP